MYFHKIFGEFKTYLDSAGHGGAFTIALVGGVLYVSMTVEE